MGIIDFYHLTLLSVTLSLASNHGCGGKQHLFDSFLEHFSTDQGTVRCGVKAIQTEHPDATFE